MRVQRTAHLGPPTVRSATQVQQILSRSTALELDFSAVYKIHTLYDIFNNHMGVFIHFEKSE